MNWEPSQYLQHPESATLKKSTLDKFYPLKIKFFQDYQETFWHPLPSLRFEFGQKLVKKREVPTFCKAEKVEEYGLNMQIKIDSPD